MKTNGMGRIVAALALMAAGAFASSNSGLSASDLGTAGKAATVPADTRTVPLSDAAIAAGLGLLGLMSGRKKPNVPK